MSDFQQWQESNARQLSEALARLRERLERCAQRKTATPSSPTKPSPAPPPRPNLATKKVSRSLLQRLLASSSSEAKTSASTAAAERSSKGSAVKETETTPPEFPSALTVLSQRLGLSSFEQDVLLLCAAMELDTRVPSLCAHAQDDPQKPFPTFALALTLFDNPVWDVLSPERPLRYFRLIEIHQPGAQCLTASALRADERIVNYLKGLNYLDDRLATLLAPLPLDAGTACLAPSQANLVEKMLGRLRQVAEISPWPLIQLLGPDAISKQLVARYAAAQLGRSIYRLPVEVLPSQPADLETLARLWHRESMLLPLALFLDAQELDSGSVDKLNAVIRFTGRSDGVFLLASREAVLRTGGGSPFVFDVAKPTATEQQGAWIEALGVQAKDSPAVLAGQFNFNLSTLRQIAQFARQESADAPSSLDGKIWDACCACESPRLDALAQRLEPKMTWDDLVLPAAETALLKQIAAQVRQRARVYGEWGFARKMNRGLGISALFSGDSGTGKTMAAEVIANELRLNLYRIDLSQVVNKYIGETEKNLRRLFDASEDGGAILFFDEADALFGKRSEVKDSHDRYANIEINYLLQRMEAFSGLAILATNMKSALDAAFLRRLRFIVHFPFPSLADRRRIWQNVFPKRGASTNIPFAPVAELDYDRLARLNLAGGYIQNIALNAAFLAARAGTPVTMGLILEAARAEFLKMERPISAADFQWTERQVRNNHIPTLEAAHV